MGKPVYPVDWSRIAVYTAVMKTTIDLPEDVVERAKIEAAKRHTTLKNLVIEGLEEVLRKDAPEVMVDGALQRLQKGLHLGGRPLTREDLHAG